MRWLALLAFVLASACHMSPDKAMAELHNPDPMMRQKAADSLRSDEMSPQSVQALLDAVRSEQDPKARAAMIISLGASGAPEAKPVVDDYVAHAATHDDQRYAGRALKYFMWKTNQLPRDYAFPEMWPYGQPGYPPVIP